MKIFITALLLALTAYGNAQPKTDKEMELEKTKLKELIRQELTMVKRYPHKPAYYVQVNKNGCRVIVKVNDIPLGFNFAKDQGQTMLYPVNGLLFGSGEHTLSVEVHPLTTQQTVSVGTWVNLKVVHFPEKEGSDSEVIAELNVPNDIGSKKLSVYSQSVGFKATLPFDYKRVLGTAKDLNKVPDLEAKVVAHYNKVRNLMIAGDLYQHSKMRLNSTWVLTDMYYLTEENLNAAYLEPDELFRFNCKVTDWEIDPIENYEMIICGYGKLVYLQRKNTLDQVLRTTYDSGKGWYASTKFIALYMPQDSNELVELY